MKTANLKKQKPQVTYVHIHAVCPQFEIHEQLPQDKAIERLKGLKNLFISLGEKSDNAGRLVVKTGVVNPTLF